MDSRTNDRQDNNILREISDLETRLRMAMVKSDVAELDRLISPDLVFTSHLGVLYSKEDDLNAHRSGAIKIDEVTLIEEKIQPIDRLAIVSAKVRITGTMAAVTSTAEFRFTRVWMHQQERWQIIVGHASLLVDS